MLSSPRILPYLPCIVCCGLLSLLPLLYHVLFVVGCYHPFNRFNYVLSLVGFYHPSIFSTLYLFSWLLSHTNLLHLVLFVVGCYHPSNLLPCIFCCWLKLPIQSSLPCIVLVGCCLLSWFISPLNLPYLALFVVGC